MFKAKNDSYLGYKMCSCNTYDNLGQAYCLVLFEMVKY